MISFVYFDLGGVAILDFSGTNKWAQLRQELGITPNKDAEFNRFWEKYEGELCLGRDAETLIPLIEKTFSTKLPKGYSLLIDGFVNRFEANRSIQPIIDEIHKHCRIGLLTDMYPHMFEAIKNRGLLPAVEWDTIIDSSVVGLRKTNPKIFQLAQERAKVLAEEILYAENNAVKVKTAQNLGWQTFLYDSANPKDSSQKLLELFRRLK